MTDIAQAFDAAVERFGQRVAIVDGSGGETSFADLQRRSLGFAAELRWRGIAKGDRVLVAMPVSADLYAALAALWRVGAVAVFPEPALGLRGLRHALRTVQPKAFFAAGVYRWLRLIVPALWPLIHIGPIERATMLTKTVVIQPDDPALISFTSGSTGLPKGISRSHGFLMAQHAAVAPILGSKTETRDLVAFPVFVLVNLAAGRTSVLPNWKLAKPQEVSAQVLAAWVAKTRANRMLIPPVLCETCARDGVPGGVDTIFTGGGPVFPDVLQRLHRQRPDLRLVAVYGSTEAEPIAEIDTRAIGAKDWADMAAGKGLLAGHPVDAVRLRLIDDEIQVAGGHVNRGYLDPKRNDGVKVADGDTIWHRTGDAGELDAMGRLWLLGRWARPVPACGYPFQVETAARFWPGVVKAALVTMTEGPILAIEGDRSMQKVWTEKAMQLGVEDVRWVTKVPMDARHGSKVDTIALRRLLQTG